MAMTELCILVLTSWIMHTLFYCTVPHILTVLYKEATPIWKFLVDSGIILINKPYFILYSKHVLFDF